MEINYYGYAERYEARDEEIKEGDIIMPGCHWSYEMADSECDLHGANVYKFECNNAAGHKIDYEKIDEDSENYDAEYDNDCYKLGINAYCSEEKEVVIFNKKFRVLYVHEKEIDEFSGGYLPQIVEVEMISG